jgi:hypothetical protein
MSEDMTLWKDSLQRFVFVERGYRPLIGVDAWPPIYNFEYKALLEKRMNEGEITLEGQRARVHEKRSSVEERCQ